jgi:uncharacterized protein
MIDLELLSILCCPETHTDLLPASQEQTNAINRAITKGIVSNRKGDSVTEPIQMALVRSDQKFAYIVRDDIPVMLIEESIPLDNLI